MRKKQPKPTKVTSQKRQYSLSALKNAYKYIQKHKISVRKAALMFNIPESTLRDRKKRKCDPDTCYLITKGPTPVFESSEESVLAEHFNTMTSFGCTYTQKECASIANDYAIQLLKKNCDKPLSVKWFLGFLKRWPHVRVVNPKRAKKASKDAIMKYFQNLKSTISKHKLKPDQIYNISEKSLHVQHKPSSTVASSSDRTSESGQKITLLACGNASGQSIPPYFVFPGQRMRPEVLEGASPGADYTVSDTGLCNGVVYRKYIEHHFLKFVPSYDNGKVLLILEEHKSKVPVGLMDWALQLDIILLFLPSNCSHILQPMEVGCFGHFQEIYDTLCHKMVQETSVVITRFNVCQVACAAYSKAMTPDTIMASFRYTGIHPVNPDIVPNDLPSPPKVEQEDFRDSDTDSDATVEGGKKTASPRAESISKKRETTQKSKSKQQSGKRKTKSKKQLKPNEIKRKKGLYSPTALKNAYNYFQEHKISVRKTAVMFNVPESTLRDRTLGRVHPDTLSSGPPPIFEKSEEAILAKHFETMASFGCGYTQKECASIASDYAIQLLKKSRDKALSVNWLRGFLKRWPDLKFKPRREKMASKEDVMKYFQNLKSTISKHELKPDQIFNISEKSLHVQHKPSSTVANSPDKTSESGQKITLLACGSASGQSIPPYLEVLEGASPGTEGTVSETGSSNGNIFRKYLEDHFLKFVDVPNNGKVMVILDGHKPNVSVGLAEWALPLGIIIFVLPPHCGHFLLPMDVGCFGPFQDIYDALCHKWLQETSAVITCSNVCQMACTAYFEAMKPDTIMASFRDTGINPVNPDVVPDDLPLPPGVYQEDTSDSDTDSEVTVKGDREAASPRPESILKKKEIIFKKVKSEHQSKKSKTISEKQQKPRVEGKKRQYSPTALKNAYNYLKEHEISVRKAAVMFSVPESTLRDRAMGVVHPDTLSSGPSPFFDKSEEAILVKHFNTMAVYGYHYNGKECMRIATDYAVQLSKRNRDHHKPLSGKWLRGFVRRWPDLKVGNPKRAKKASKDAIMKYFQNLKSTISKHKLKPDQIYNISEKSLHVQHKPSSTVASSSDRTSESGQKITLLACGSASGQSIPPYFVFPGQRMRPELLEGASPGTAVTVTKAGSYNGHVFRKYLEDHFLKFIPGRANTKVLLILDGQKTHVSVGLVDWALQLGIIIFFLPPYCSHIFQPMNIGCFRPFQEIYNTLCHKLMQETSSAVTCENVCKVACTAYSKAMTPETIIASFRHSGSSPVNPGVIPKNLPPPPEEQEDTSGSDSE